MKRTALKRGTTPLKRYTPLRPRSKNNSRPPAESNYLKWIRTLNCVVCGGANGAKSEAAHTLILGAAGCGRKSPNRSCIPLCPWCHRLDGDSYHSLTPESAWEEYHDVDLQQLVFDLNERFSRLKGNQRKGVDPTSVPLPDLGTRFNEAADSDDSLSDAELAA